MTTTITSEIASQGLVRGPLGTGEGLHAAFRPRLQRITLNAQLVGTADGRKAVVIDVSLSGALVAHQFRAHVGNRLRLEFDWRGEAVIADCEVMRAQLHAPPVRGAPAHYRSGVAFRSFLHDSDSVLHTMVCDLVTRALDEQKANAKGIPPAMASSVQTGGKGPGYLKLVFVHGLWQRFETVHPEQPEEGFTLSIAESPEEIEMLCGAWKNAPPSQRGMIREMARMSISSEDGIPARRYEP